MVQIIVTNADVARASCPLSRERPAPAQRGQDAHATAGVTPALVRLRAHTIREVEVLSEST